MTGDSVASELVDYALGLEPDDLDGATIEVTKDRILDAVGCAVITASNAEPAIESLVTFSTTGPDEATVLGSAAPGPLGRVAMANAGLIRYLDWNDTYFTWNETYDAASAGHPSGTIGPVLAVAEATEATGEDILVATVAAYEVFCRCIEETVFQEDGLDHTTAALIASTLAGGRLRQMSDETLLEAVNIALGSHIPLWQNRSGELSDWKGLAVGEAARNAIDSIELAGLGLTGPKPVIEGRYGLANLLTHNPDLDPRRFGGNDGEFLINETTIKPFPVCGGIQAPLVCALELTESQDFDWTDVEAIRITTTPHTIKVCADSDAKWRPTNRNTADHSLPYCIARTLADGAISADSFYGSRLTDEAVTYLMDRMSIDEGEEASVTIEVAGRTLAASVGHEEYREHPLAEQALDEKVERTLGRALQPEQVEEVVAWVEGIEDQPSVDGLIAATDC